MNSLSATLLVSLVFPPCLPAASYFVTKTGSDTNAGTAAFPFLTVQKGVNTAQPGDAVLVGAGTYSENLISARNGTNGGPIILDGQGVAVIPSLYISHQYLYFRNFTVAGKANGWWLFLEKGAHHCVISNNVFDGEFNTNVFSSGGMLRWNNPSTGTETPFGGDIASGVLVISNTFKRWMGAPVITLFGDTNVIYGNRLIDGDAVDWFRVWGRSNYIAANLCSNSFQSGISGNHPDVVQTFGGNGAGADGIVIESNTIVAGHGDCQICMFEGQDCPYFHNFTFRNNLFVGIACKGTMAFPEVNWYNNIFVNCATNAAASPITLIFTAATNATYTNFAYSCGHSCKVFNNVFLNCGNTNTDRGWYQFATYLTNVQSDYNFVAKNGYHPVNVDSLHRSVGDLGGWNIWAWWESHGVNGGYPNFADPANGDFDLGTNSILYAAGTNLSAFFTTDMSGRIRPTLGPWTIGSYEAAGSVLTTGRPTPPSNLRVLQTP